jgi:hypothetical protein
VRECGLCESRESSQQGGGEGRRSCACGAENKDGAC